MRMETVNHSGSALFKTVLMGLVSLLLVSCSDPEVDDLHQHIEDVRVKAVKAAEHAKPLDFNFEVKKKVASYKISGAKRDPFISWVMAPRKVLMQSGKGPKPNKRRRRETLESYPLDSLKLTGTFKSGGDEIALIKAPNGVVHRIKTGNYMGSNYGKVIKITKSAVKLRELIPNGMGGWESRTASLSMKR